MSGAVRQGDLSILRGDAGLKTGPLVEGSSSVMVNDRGLVTLAESGIADGASYQVAQTSPGVIAGDRAVARVGDGTKAGSALGKIVSGSDNVLVGEGAPPSTSDGGAAWSAGAALVYQGTKRALEGVRYVMRVDGEEIGRGTTDDLGRTKRHPTKGAVAVALELLHGKTAKVARSVPIPASASQEAWTAVPITQPRVTVYLLHARYPARREHVGILRVTRRVLLAWDLWPKAFHPNLLLHEPNAPKVKGAKTNGWARAIQSLHRANKPDRSVFDAPPTATDIALPAPVLLLEIHCKNHDDNKKVDYADGTVLQVPTWEDGNTYRLDGLEKDEFGVFQRLSVTPSLAQVHSGREWRHTHKANGASHLIPDLDHTAAKAQWTNLHITYGCLRISRLSAERLYEALTPVRDASFTWSTAAGKDWKEEGWERCNPEVTTEKIDRAEPDSIAMVYAEEYLPPERRDLPEAQRLWCACEAVSVPVAVASTSNERRWGALRDGTIHACVTAAWSAAQWELFFTKGVVVDAKLYASLAPPAP